MKLHSQQDFIVNVGANTSYNPEELELLWEMCSTDILDLMSELCSKLYQAGYTACTEDRM